MTTDAMVDLDEPVAFDSRPVHVEGGPDLVVRLPGLVALIHRADTDDSVINELLESLRTVSATAPVAPGTSLARQLSLWLAGCDAPPAFGTVAATGEGIAVFLHGPVSLSSSDGELALSGSDAAFAVDRVLPDPEGALLLAGDDAPVPGPSRLPEWAGLQAGVVSGMSVTIGSRMAAADQVRSERPLPAEVASTLSGEVPLEQPAPTPQPEAAEPIAAQLPTAQTPGPDGTATAPPGLAEPAPPATPEPAPPAPAPQPTAAAAVSRPPAVPVQHPVTAEAPAAPRLVEQIHDAVPEPPRAPLPIAGQAPPQSSRERQEEAQRNAAQRPGAYVKGFRCSRGHLNDPRVSFCRLCGIRMDHVTGILTFERRPPLGLIVLDAGTSFVLDDNYILGRTPQVAEEVQSGRHRPIQIDDSSGSLSRAHAEIRLEDWDVLLIDRGSANGTFVAGPNPSGGFLPWTRLAPAQKFVLTPGTQVQVGRRRFVFESSAARL